MYFCKVLQKDGSQRKQFWPVIIQSRSFRLRPTIEYLNYQLSSNFGMDAKLVSSWLKVRAVDCGRNKLRSVSGFKTRYYDSRVYKLSPG